MTITWGSDRARIGRPCVFGAALIAALLVACSREQPASQTNSDAGPNAAPIASAAPAQIAPPSDLSDTCRRICDNSRKLECKNAGECEGNCQAMGSLKPCIQPMQEFYRCLTGQAVDKWECAEDGVAAIREGFCEMQQERAIGCMEQNLKQ